MKINATTLTLKNCDGELETLRDVKFSKNIDGWIYFSGTRINGELFHGRLNTEKVEDLKC